MVDVCLGYDTKIMYIKPSEFPSGCSESPHLKEGPSRPAFLLKTHFKNRFIALHVHSVHST